MIYAHGPKFLYVPLPPRTIMTQINSNKSNECHMSRNIEDPPYYKSITLISRFLLLKRRGSNIPPKNRTPVPYGTPYQSSHVTTIKQSDPPLPTGGKRGCAYNVHVLYDCFISLIFLLLLLVIIVGCCRFESRLHRCWTIRILYARWGIGMELGIVL